MKVRVVRSTEGPSNQHVLAPEIEVGLRPDQWNVAIDPDITYQTHLGFGGAITEAVAFTLRADMPRVAYRETLRAYFSAHGLRYNMTRIAMNSCDFSLNNYCYIAKDDIKLRTFDISREDKYVVPFLQDVLQCCPDLKVLMSPWSPPGFMKDNGEMNHGGKLLPRYAEAWARYYLRFIEALDRRGIRVWATTVQNEPAAVQTWDSCIYSAEEERDFVKHYLGPTIAASNYSHVKILIWDHNQDIILDRVKPILSEKETSRYVWGTAFHWYVAEIPENLSKIHALYPDKHLLFTEGCIEGGPRPGVWQSGERYARNIINDLNHDTEGFIDWNIVLNEQGGPNHVGNYCDAPILADRKTQTLIYNSSYYAIGHFSRFITPGAVRIDHVAHVPEGVRLVTYLNPNGSLVIVVQNETEQPAPVSFAIQTRGFSDVLPRHSFTTYVIRGFRRKR